MIQKSDILQMLTDIHKDLEKLEKSLDFQIPDSERDLSKKLEKKLWKTENHYYILEGKFNLVKEQEQSERQNKRTTA